MARDDQLIYGSKEFRDYGVTDAGAYELWYVGSNGHLSTDIIRDDSHPTIPINGTFVYPSIYWNQGCRLKSHPYGYFLDSSKTPYHQYKKHYVSGDSGSSFWPIPFNTFGCGATRPHLPLVSSWVISACESDALQKMKSQDFNAGVFLAELPETVEYIAGIVEPLAELFMAWRNKDKILLKAGASAKKLAEAWLGFTLAAKPLMDDIYNAAVACVQGFHVPLFAIARVEKIDPDFGPKMPQFPFQDWFWHYEDNSVCKRGVNVELAYKVLNPTLYALDSFGILNPIALAWEALPLSFVVDYFFGIGNFLNAMQAPIGIELVYGYRTSWLKNTYDVTYVPKAYDGLGDGVYPRITGELKVFERYVYPDFPLPFPALHLPVSVTKAANLVALVLSRD